MGNICTAFSTSHDIIHKTIALFCKDNIIEKLHKKASILIIKKKSLK